MEMIRNQRPAVAGRGGFLQNRTESFQKPVSIGIVFKNVSSLDTPAYDMMKLYLNDIMTAGSSNMPGHRQDNIHARSSPSGHSSRLPFQNNPDFPQYVECFE